MSELFISLQNVLICYFRQQLGNLKCGRTKLPDGFTLQLKQMTQALVSTWMTEQDGLVLFRY